MSMGTRHERKDSGAERAHREAAGQMKLEEWMKRPAVTVLAIVAMMVAGVAAQQSRRPASPPGEAATQMAGHWIELSYGRPILRGRANIFGSGADYGETVNDGGPAWRAGANRTTLMRT